MADSAGQSLERESRREDRIRELQDRIRMYENQQQAAERPAAGSTRERPRFQTEIENVQAEINLLEQARGRRDGAVDPPAEFALALGSAYLRAGSIEDAERAYREALRLRPKYGEAHNNLAVICIKRGDYEEAYVHVKAAQKAGFKVHPQLVSDIETARRDGRK
jgi:tetratricopeptide (TPR) repeat protein